MKDIIAALLLAASASAAPSTPTATAPTALAVGEQTHAGGVGVACAGIGRADREDSRWAAYNVRVEFSNPRAEYLVGAAVAVRDAKGRVLLTTDRCEAPWVLLQMPTGAYIVEARLGEITRSVRVLAPKAGQQRVVLQFPDT